MRNVSKLRRVKITVPSLVPFEIVSWIYSSSDFFSDQVLSLSFDNWLFNVALIVIVYWWIDLVLAAMKLRSNISCVTKAGAEFIRWIVLSKFEIIQNVISCLFALTCLMASSYWPQRKSWIYLWLFIFVNFVKKCYKILCLNFRVIILLKFNTWLIWVH